MVLLKNGHILVLKEKSPRALIEFGRVGERAAGYALGGAVGVDDTFSDVDGRAKRLGPALQLGAKKAREASRRERAYGCS